MKMPCPHCGRLLQIPEGANQIECDGCEQPFELSRLRKVPASTGRRVFGGVLVVLGILLFLVSLSGLLKGRRFQSTDEVVAFAGGLVPGILCLAGGSTLMRGKVKLGEGPAAPSQPDGA